MNHKTRKYDQVLLGVLNTIKNDNDVRFSVICRRARITGKLYEEIIPQLLDAQWIKMTEKKPPTASGRKRKKPFTVYNITHLGLIAIKKFEEFNQLLVDSGLRS